MPASRQDYLGDDDAAETRLVAVKEKVAYKLSLLGDAGIRKPKEVLEFMQNVKSQKYDAVDILSPKNSTAASRV